MPEGVTNKCPFVERSVASMKSAIKVAENNNVIFNMEVVNRLEQLTLSTCEEAIAYVGIVDSPNAKILHDTNHISIEEDFIDAIVRAGDKLGHLHFGENDRMPPGFGHIRWTKIGYRGHGTTPDTRRAGTL
jgi:D-psicose/D-tagatose/L-ribulose 3-epimerase